MNNQKNNETTSEKEELKNEDYILTDDNLQRFRNLLMKGLIEEAVQLQKQKNFTDSDILPHVSYAFLSFKQSGDSQKVLDIVKQFNFILEDTKQVFIDEWTWLFNEEKYEEAAQWAKEQNLSIVEIDRSATKAYEKYIREGKIEEALRVMDEFNLSKKNILGITIEEFNRTCDAGEYYKAALIGQKFNFSPARTLSIAMQACKLELQNENFEFAVEIIENFNLFSDDTFKLVHEDEAENFSLIVLKNFIEPAFLKGNLKLIQVLVKKTNLINQTFEHRLLASFLQEFYKIAIITHNKLLLNDEIKPAQFILHTLSLFKAPISDDLYASLIEASEKFHNSLLKSGDLEGAISFKNNYGLFDRHVTKDSVESGFKQAALFATRALKKGDFSSAITAINEYKIPEYLVNDSAFAAIMNLMNEQIYGKAFAILKEFKIDTSKKKIHERILDKFSELMNQKEYAVAAEFAKLSRLNKYYIDESAYKAWEKEFLSRNFDTAWNLKKNYKIPKKSILPLATQTYWKYMGKKDYEMAVLIRSTYGVRLSFMQLIQEFFRSLFSR